MSRNQQLVRLALWGYVFAHAWLSWRTVILWPVALIFLISTDMAATYFIKWHQQKKKKICIALILCVLALPFLIWLISWLIDSFVISLPLAQIYTGLILTPLWLPAWLFFLLSILIRLYPRMYRYDLIPRLIVLILAFWAGNQYQILFYSHPGTLLLSLLLYLTTEALVLMWQNPALNNGKLHIPLRAIPSFFLFIIPMAMLCFIAYYFVSKTLTRNTSGVIKPTVNSFDFSDFLNLENEIQLGQNLLLFVHLDKDPQEKLLFKRHDLGGYDPEKGFFAMKDLTSSYQVPKEPTRFTSPHYQDRETVKQEFYLIDLERNAFFSMNYPTEVIPIKPSRVSSKFRSAYMVKAETILDKDTLETDPNIFLAGHSQLISYERSIYLDYANLTEIADLAQQIVDDEPSSYNKAKMLETYFKLHYLYSLKPGEGSGQKKHKEALLDFLLNTRRGYCTYFAFSMALMARSLGMPARVASGFFINPQDSLMGYYPVKAQQAHAWVEIYFDDYGWISFDPTSDQLAVDSMDNVESSYEPDELYPFVEEMIKARSQFNSEDLAKQEFKTTSDQNLLQDSFSLRNLYIILATIMIVYALLILWAHAPFLLRNHLSNREKIQLYVRRLVFQYNSLMYTRLSTLEYLAQSSVLVDIYRHALFAPSFTDAQAEQFIKLSKHYTPAGHLSFLRKIFFNLSPLWIKFRIEYVKLS